MAAAIRTITTNSSTTATVAVTTPSGGTAAIVGDVLHIVHNNDFYVLGNMPTPTVNGSTTGVTSIVNADGGTDQAHVKSYYFVVTSAGAQTVSVTESPGGDEEKSLQVYVLQDVDTTGSPVDVSAANTGVSSTSHVAPSVTTTLANDLLLCHVNSGGGANGGAYTQPSGMTEDYDFQVAAAMSVGGASLLVAAIGATGTKTFTATNSVPFAAISVAYKSAVAAGFVSPKIIVAPSASVIRASTW